MKEARDPTPSRKNPRVSLQNAPGILLVRRFLMALVGMKQTVARDQLFSS